MELLDRHIAAIKIDEMQEAVSQMELVILQKDEKAYQKLLNRMRDAILMAYDEQKKAALSDALKYLSNKSGITFDEADAKYIDEILSAKLGDDLNNLVADDIEKLTGEVLKLGKKEILAPINFKLSFSIKDKEAAAILAQQNLFWIGGYYGSTLKSKFDELTAGYFNSNKTLQEVADDFLKSFNKYTNQGDQYFYDLAEHQTNTVRELGKVNGLVQAEIKYYEIRAVIDDRTSDICIRLNGTVFPTERAVEYRDNILSLNNPDDIKEASPWLNPDEVAALPADDADLPAGLSLPPYHFRCRTIIVSYFK